MIVETPPLKSKLYNAVMFSIMFIACLIGSVAILVIAVGLETGNKIVNGMMQSLVEYAFYVIAAFVFFNIFVFWVYSKNSKRR